ncbi:MAG: hypothetical protein IJ848_01810, partial [Alphaproteobacteria bacterium]|nr:hypothetical protein [Alphaproteobacteria bacterium]
WAEFFFDPKRIESEDDGMKDAQYLWTKLSSSEQIKAQIRAREKYALCSDSEIAIALARVLSSNSEIDSYFVTK